MRTFPWSGASVLFAALLPGALLAGPPAARAQEPPALVRLLQEKGLISEAESAMLARDTLADEAEQRLARLLIAKRVISEEDYARARAARDTRAIAAAPGEGMEGVVTHELRPRIATAMFAAAPPPRLLPQPPRPAESSSAAELSPPSRAARQETKPPAVIPAVSPMRVLPITPPARDGLLPDLKLGSGARLRPYGFLKVSVAHQSAGSGGRTFGSNDFPQGPLLLADTGPDGDPQFHVKARASRAGVDFEWPDASRRVVLTGKLEIDFEGNFTDVNNRNISANRSSEPSLRLAWARLSTTIGRHPWFIQFGQDWSIFGSSTLMDLFETTGFGFAQGNLYERLPMVRTGIQFGSGALRIQPEFALALPGFGEPGLDADQRQRFGGRVGPESNQPELMGRVVAQFPLSHEPGVDPAQVIFSIDHAKRAEIIDAASLPAGPIRDTFPTGLRLTSTRNAWSAEMQAPLPWVTLTGKYYRGDDLRYYFMGQFNDIFTDLRGAAPIGMATSFSGRTIPFGLVNGVVTPARLEPIDGQGGFVQAGVPISRLLGVDPGSRAAGWTAYGTWGIDTADDDEAARGNGLRRTDHFSAQVRYKLNRWVTFAHEETYIRTRTASGVLRPFKGILTDRAHAWRTEFGTIFTF